MNTASRRYHATQIETASPGELVVMLYNGALRALGRAQRAAEEDGAQRFGQVASNIAVARQILAELSTSLDFNQGILPRRLFALYAYMARRLSDAIGTNGGPVIEEVSNLLRELREAWADACAQECGPPRAVSQAVDVSC